MSKEPPVGFKPPFLIATFRPFGLQTPRIAFFATDVFLRLNGWKMSVDGIEAHEFLIGRLDAGTCDYQALLEWIRESLSET